MSRSSAGFLAMSAVGFIATAPAMAADPVPTSDAAKEADDQTRSDVIVTGSRGAQLDNPKATEALVNTPRSIVVLPAEVIDQSGSATLAEALRTVPGITFGAAEGGNPVGDRPFIRGFDSQGSTYLDGVRDVAAQSREVFAVEQVQVVRGSDSTLGGRGSAGGSINIISKLPRADSDFIAVSGSYGTADYKRVTGDANYRVADTVGVRIASLWHDQDFAGRDSIYARRWGVAPSVTIGLGTATRLTAAYYYLESHELPDSGIPYLYNLANAPLGSTYSQPAIGAITTIAGTRGVVDRSTFFGLENRDFRDQKTHQATLRVEHDFGGVTIRNTSRYSHNDQSYIYTQPDDQQGNVFGTNAASPATAGGLVWRRANSRYGYVEALVNQTDVYGTLMTGGIKHSFDVGAEFAWEKARRGTFVTASGSTIAPRCTPAAIARFYCTSLFNPNPADPFVNYTSDTSSVATPIVRTLPIQQTQNDANSQSVYAFDSITISDALIVNLGARYDRFSSRVTPGQAATATSTFRLRRTDNIFNYQAGVVFKPTRNTTLYASFATAATPPNSLIGEGAEGNALGTANTPDALALLDSLKVEKTKSYEVGAKANVFGEKLALTAAVFQTDTSNARVTGPNNTVEFIGERRIRGVEVGFNGNVTRFWSVFGGYTYLDATIVDGGFSALTAPAVGTAPAQVVLVPSVNTGKPAPQTAKHSFTLWTNLNIGNRLSVGGGAFYQSRVFGGFQDNRSATQTGGGVVTVNPATKLLVRTVPDYWRFDARAGFKVNDRVELSVNVQNLTDKAYFPQAFTAHYASIAAGRSAFGTLSIRY